MILDQKKNNNNNCNEILIFKKNREIMIKNPE